MTHMAVDSRQPYSRWQYTRCTLDCVRVRIKWTAKPVVVSCASHLCICLRPEFAYTLHIKHFHFRLTFSSSRSAASWRSLPRRSGTIFFTKMSIKFYHVTWYVDSQPVPWNRADCWCNIRRSHCHYFDATCPTLSGKSFPWQVSSQRFSNTSAQLHAVAPCHRVFGDMPYY